MAIATTIRFDEADKSEATDLLKSMGISFNGYLAMAVKQLINQQIAETGTLVEVVDSFDTEIVTRELEVVCPGFVGYRVGVEDSFSEDYEVVTQRVVATVTSAKELKPSRKREIEALIRIYVTDLDEVQFEVGDA